jgi:hypothetical protein
LKDRVSEGLSHQSSFICYEIKHDSSWGRLWADPDSWEIGLLKENEVPNHNEEGEK